MATPLPINIFLPVLNYSPVAPLAPTATLLLNRHYLGSRILTQLGTSSDTVERIQKFQGVKLPCGAVRSEDLRIQDRPKRALITGRL